MSECMVTRPPQALCAISANLAIISLSKLEREKHGWDSGGFLYSVSLPRNNRYNVC